VDYSVLHSDVFLSHFSITLKKRVGNTESTNISVPWLNLNLTCLEMSNVRRVIVWGNVNYCVSNYFSHTKEI
jgi:hypothetical protein